MNFFKDTYRKLNATLEPAQGVVTLLLLVIIAVSVWMLFQDPVKRTAWTVYMFMP